VLDPNDRDATAAQGAHDRDQFIRFGVGETGADLVEKENARAAAERARKFEAFAIEQAQCAGLTIRNAQHAAQRQRLDTRFVRRRTRELAALRRRDEDVFEDGHFRERPRNLMRSPDAQSTALGRAQPRDIGAGEGDVTRRRRVRACENVEQRRLPRPVGPHDAHRFVRGEREIDAIDGDERIETLRDGSRDEHVHHQLYGSSFAATGMLRSFAFSVKTISKGYLLPAFALIH